MRFTFSAFALFALCSSVLATSSASAQVTALPLRMAIYSQADMSVTLNGVTTPCSGVRSNTSNYYLPPAIGAYYIHTRGLRCGHITVQVSQSFEVTNLI